MAKIDKINALNQLTLVDGLVMRVHGDVFAIQCCSAECKNGCNSLDRVRSVIGMIEKILESSAIIQSRSGFGNKTMSVLWGLAENCIDTWDQEVVSFFDELSRGRSENGGNPLSFRTSSSEPPAVTELDRSFNQDLKALDINYCDGVFLVVPSYDVDPEVTGADRIRSGFKAIWYPL